MGTFVDQYNNLPDIHQPVAMSSAHPVNAPAQKSSGGIGGFLGRAGKSLLQAPEYFGKNFETLGKITAAKVTGNKDAQYNAALEGAKNVGLTVKNGNQVSGYGNAAKKLAGNSAQVATMLVAPEAKAGFAAKAAQGAKIGSVAGAGSALANNQNVATGAIEGGLTGGVAGGILGKLVKGKTGAVAPAEVSNGGSKLGNRMIEKGTQTEARAGGFGQGEKAAGGQPLGYYDSKKISNTLKSEGVKGGSASARQKAVDDALGLHGQKIDALVAEHNTPLGAADRHTIATEFLNKIENQPGVTDQVRASAENLANNFTKQAEDTKGLINFRRGMDSQVIAFNRNPDAKQAADQLAARTFRDILSKKTNDFVPGIKEANSSYHNLTQANEFLKQAARDASNTSTRSSGGIAGRVLSSEPVEAAKSKAGQAQQALGKALGGSEERPMLKAAAGNPPPVQPATGAASTAEIAKAAPAAVQAANPSFLNNLVTGVKGRVPIAGAIGAGAAAGNPPQQEQQPADTNFPSELNTAPDQTNSEQSPQSGFDQNMLLEAIAADPKNASTYLALFSALKPSASATKLNASQQQQANNAQSALSNIADIRSMLSDNPSLATKSGIPGQGSIIGGLESNVLGTGKYNAALNNLTDVIGRLRSGAALSAAEEARYKALAPKAGDSASTINYKLSNLEELLNKFASPNSTGGSDVTDLLSNAGVR